jgi:bifunctional lysine-specific demethylase and histidyl-hydroxylase NO66
VVRRRPGAVCRLHPAGGRLDVQLGDRQLSMPAALEPVMRKVLAAGSFTVADLGEHLDGPSRLLLVRRLVREGLLESVAVG